MPSTARQPRFRPTYAVATGIYLRLLGVVYLVAFASLWVQIRGLIGSTGILPMADYLARASEVLVGTARLTRVPTVFWLSHTDLALDVVCGLGVVAALLVAVGRAQAWALALAWLLYLSLVTVGQTFLGFQWDNLLLEAGLLAIFLRPPRWRSRPEVPSRLAWWLHAWLLFRLMVASGVVKLTSGDAAWRGLTALQVHYETQPLPTVLGWWAHQLPAGLHSLSTVVMFGVELLVPLLIFAPARWRRWAVPPLLGLQVLIAATGNYGFFNLLTAALCLLLLDDAVFPTRWRPLDLGGPGSLLARATWLPRLWRWACVPLAAVVLTVSLMPFLGAFGGSPPWPQWLRSTRAALAPLRSINGYGLFAVMTTERPELVIEGSRDGEMWRAYSFRWKPGEVTRRPPFVAPHMPRLDWQMWFAALGDARRNPWLITLLARLAEGEPAVTRLLAEDPFADGAPPQFLRVRRVGYRFSDREARHTDGAWWQVEEDSAPTWYLPTVTAEQLRAFTGR